jgi:G3E family GTPase
MKIKNVPTNIISGFLGVGKTTAILSLFKNKPETEKWAVLVNEFGKIGIDGYIYQANGITVKQIPGGCICCAQGLPMLMAVNRLLRETMPDRLIIESSGIGHPAGVLKTLKAENFNTVLTIKAGICVVDPRHLLHPAYQKNDLFKEQLQMADILVANKIDLAQERDIAAFNSLAKSFSQNKELIATTNNGLLNTKWLDYTHSTRYQNESFTINSENQPVPQSEYWQTHSFSFSNDIVFDLNALKSCLVKIELMRLKGLIQTKDGCYLVNYTNGQVDFSQFDDQNSNYMEVINGTINVSELEQAIIRCAL